MDWRDEVMVQVAELYCARCKRVVDICADVTKYRCVRGVECPRCSGHSTTWMNLLHPASSSGCIFGVDEEDWYNIKQRMAPQFRGDRVGGTCGECGDVDRCNEDWERWKTCWYPGGSIMVKEEQDAEI